MAKTFTVPSIFTAIDKFSSPVKKMQSSVTSFAQKAEVGIARADRAFRRLTPSLGKAAKQMLSFASAAAIGAAIFAGINFTIGAIKDYETALASAQAITGTSNKEFALFRKQIELVATTTKKSAVEVAEGFEIVGSAQPELLKSATALAAVTKASIILSKASRDDLGTSAKNLTGVMNQFGLSAGDADRVINVLAAGSVVGSANITQVGDSMKNFGSVAAVANLSIEESVALVEVLGKFSVFGAEAGTKLRGAVLKLQKANVGYASGQFNVNDALLEAKKKIDNLATAQQKDRAILKIFGAENVSTGNILLKNIGLFQELTKGVTGTTIANKQAAINSATLAVALDEMKAAWVNIIVSSNKAGSALSSVRKVVIFLTKNLSTIVSVGVKIILFFVAWKAIILASKLALVGYNIALGIQGALTGSASIAIGANAIALGAYKLVLAVVTGAQWLWNAALLANPIGLIILGVAALIALITFIIIKYDEWGAAVSLLLGPLGFVINLIQSFRRNWDMIINAFKTEGIVEGFKAIGKTILDAVLMPLQQVLEIVSKIPGFSFAAGLAEDIEKFRGKLGVNIEREVVNPEAGKQEALANTIERTNNAKVDINVNDPTGRAEVQNDQDFVKIAQTSTLNFGT